MVEKEEAGQEEAQVEIASDPLELASHLAAAYGVRAVYRERGVSEDSAEMAVIKARLQALWDLLQETLHDIEVGLVSAHLLISQLSEGQIVCSKETGDMAEEWMKAFNERYEVVER